MRTFLLLLSLLATFTTQASAQARIRDGDQFEMVVGGAPREFTEEFRLMYTVDDGHITVQYIGRIPATGLSTTQLAANIERKLREAKIFTNPTVLLNLVPSQQNQRSVLIGGAVRGPNRYPWYADMTLTAAITTAGGPSEWAEDKVRLIRGKNVEVFSRKEIKKNQALDPKLQPGDIVEVQGEL